MPENGPYGARVCAACSHPAGDHAWNRSTVNPRRGICFIAGCACREFREPEEKA